MHGYTENGTEDTGRDAAPSAPAPALRPPAPMTNARPLGDTERPAPTEGHPTGRDGAPPATDTGKAGGRDGGRFWGRRRRDADAGDTRPVPPPVVVPSPDPSAGKRPAGPVKRPGDVDRPDRPSPRPRRSPRQRSTRPGARENFGRLIYNRSRSSRVGMTVLAVLMALSLIAVVIAPPALSAQDILAWAALDDPHAGLGLKGVWPWIAFLAMDFAAAVCVLVSLFCAFRDESSGIFGIGVWAFAGITAYANYQFNTAPGSPGDGVWFFPIMSIVGPILLHGMTKMIRGWVLESAGGKRGRRPKFAVADWLPVIGSPQETFGAWRVGGTLGISIPDDALFAFRALTRRRGWWKRWMIKGVVRDAVHRALDDSLAEGELHPRLLSLLVPAIDGTDVGDGTSSPSLDPLDEIENDLLGDPPGTPRSRGTGRAPVSGPPSLSLPRVPRAKRDGTGQSATASTGQHGTHASPGVDLGDGTGRDGTVGDTPYDPDLIRYADHILAITDEFPGWRSEIPKARGARRAIDKHWRKIGRATRPGAEPGFNSISTAERVLEVMNRLAVQPGITEQIENLRETSSTE